MIASPATIKRILDDTAMHNTCYTNTMNGYCNYDCQTFRAGQCSSGQEFLQTLKPQQLEELVIEAKGFFWVAAMKALEKPIPHIDILEEYYDYTSSLYE